jgi:hypothetical protein
MDQAKHHSSRGSHPHVIVVPINWFERSKNSGNGWEIRRWWVDSVYLQPAENPVWLEREENAFVFTLPCKYRYGSHDLWAAKALGCRSLEGRERTDLYGKVLGGKLLVRRLK